MAADDDIERAKLITQRTTFMNLVLARNYKEVFPKGDMMKLTDILIGLLLYTLIADGMDLIINI